MSFLDKLLKSTKISQRTYDKVVIAKQIIEHKYMEYLLIFLQSPISLIGPIGSLAFGLVILHLACCACWRFCAICTVVHYSSERTYAFFLDGTDMKNPLSLVKTKVLSSS